MFKGIGQMAALMKQAQEMRGRMHEVQENLRRLKVEGATGGGMVKVEMNGQQQMLACQIDSALLQSGDGEMLEDLLVAAVNQALEKSKEAATQEFAKVAGGLDLSALGETLSKLGLGDAEGNS